MYVQYGDLHVQLLKKEKFNYWFWSLFDMPCRTASQIMIKWNCCNLQCKYICVVQICLGVTFFYIFSDAEIDYCCCSLFFKVVLIKKPDSIWSMSVKHPRSARSVQKVSTLSHFLNGPFTIAVYTPFTPFHTTLFTILLRWSSLEDTVNTSWHFHVVKCQKVLRSSDSRIGSVLTVQ